MKKTTTPTKKAIKAVKQAATATRKEQVASLLAASGPNEKFPFGVKVTANGATSFERFKTADEARKRLNVLGASAEAFNFNPPKAAKEAPAEKPAPAKAAKAEPAARKKVNKARDQKPKAEKKAPANGALAVHVNKTGRVCFGKAAAERIGDLGYMMITVAGNRITMTAQKKDSEGALGIGRANGRPYVSATKILKATGAFDGSAALDFEAKPVGETGLEIRVA